MPEPTLDELLRRAADSARGLWLVDRAEKDTFFSYREILSRAMAAAGGLQTLGVARGDRVAVIAPTSIGFFDAFFGCLLAGGVPVPLYPPVRLGFLDEYHARTAAMIQAAGARLLLTGGAIRMVLGSILAEANPELGAWVIEDLPKRAHSPLTVTGDDLALIQFSSGTSAAPKPVRLTHRQILANVDAIRRAILACYPEGQDLTHVGASWLPLYHDMGLIGSVVTAVRHPSDLVLIPPELFVARPAVWLRAISRHSVTVSAAPNFAYGLCVDRIRDDEIEGVDLSSWRLAFNGAEPVTPSVLERFLERFRAYGLREEALTPVYGLAEVGLAATFSEPSERFRSARFDRDLLVSKGVARPEGGGQCLVSVGKPLPGYSLRIVDDGGRDLPEDRVGSVLLQGPSLMEGYHGLPRVTAEVLRDGWLDTGDTGFLHGGELFLYGRRKDLIILRGRNYSPQDIEQSLDGLPGVRQGCWAAVGVTPDSGEGEQLVVLVERSRKEKPGNQADLSRAASERITERTGLVPSRVVVLAPGTLPRTSSGKIRRGEVKKRFLMGALRPPKIPTLELAKEFVRTILADSRRKP